MKGNKICSIVLFVFAALWAFSILIFTDFEDAVIDAVAANIHADYILTRNKKDFEHKKMQIATLLQLFLCLP